MPISPKQALDFLQTQWSSINQNKIKGITAELAFKKFLNLKEIHYISGGWIMSPGKNTINDVPTKAKICLLPRAKQFSWQVATTEDSSLTYAEVAAYSYFRQVGVTAYFVSPENLVESEFEIPRPKDGKIKSSYPQKYSLEFKEISPNGLKSVAKNIVFKEFPKRNGNMGLRCSKLDRINSTLFPWNNLDSISELFWFEYCRYFAQVDYLVSSNDLDLFIVGPSGSCYPVELKSKVVAKDPALGEWFGIDMGPYAKLAFFTANAMNTDALYVVQEVIGEARDHVSWLGIRFTDLVKSCSWVGQAGGKGMTGGASSTYKIPKKAFVCLEKLIPTL